jgi:AcrR family transcriptional regulator
MKFAVTPRQAEIEQAALAIIASKGVQNFSMRNLAERIKISEPAIYRHFSNKTEILLAILKKFFHEKTIELSEIENSELTPVAMLKQLFFNRISDFEKQPNLAAIIFSEELFKNEKKLADLVLKIMKTHQEATERIIKKGQISNRIRRDVSKSGMASIFLGTIRMHVHSWRISEQKFDLRRKGISLWKAFEKLIQIS